MGSITAWRSKSRGGGGGKVQSLAHVCFPWIDSDERWEFRFCREGCVYVRTCRWFAGLCEINDGGVGARIG